MFSHYYKIIFLSFNMAHSFLENIDDVDIISDAEVILKKFFPWSFQIYKHCLVTYMQYVPIFFIFIFLEHQETAENAIWVTIDYLFNKACKLKSMFFASSFYLGLKK